MIAYLVISFFTGIVCAVVGLIGFGVGLLGIFLWYIAGCWAGFAVSVALFLLIDSGQAAQGARWREGSTVR